MKNIVCAALVLASIWAYGAEPQLTFEQTTVNVGTVDPDTKVTNPPTKSGTAS